MVGAFLFLFPPLLRTHRRFIFAVYYLIFQVAKWFPLAKLFCIHFTLVYIPHVDLYVPYWSPYCTEAWGVIVLKGKALTVHSAAPSL